MNKYEQMASELIGQANKWDPSQAIHRELMASAGQFAIASAISDAVDVMARLEDRISFAIDQLEEDRGGV